MLVKTVTRRLAASSQEQHHENLTLTVQVLTIWILLSTFTMLMWSLAAASGQKWGLVRPALAIFSQSSLVAGCAFAVGILFGFLFGIPRTVQDDVVVTTGVNKARGTTFQSVNTNLEQISDWLTTILVGVGLTQFQNLRGEVTRLGSYFAVAGSPPITVALMVNFAIAGFFTGYLMTRLFLASAFVDVERSIRDRTTKAEELQEAGDYDAARSEYESALAQITPATAPEEKRRIYEGLIFNSLYERPPQGFQKAIEYGTRYLSEEKQHPSANVFAYLAGAYGQQAGYEKAQGVSSDRFAAIRQNALDVTRAALKIDPGIIELLRMMWDPNYPRKSPGDNDLEIFYDDAEFKALLGAERR